MAYPDNLLTAIKAVKRKPVWVVEIVFNSGDHGVEGTNDVYLATTDVANIANFPFPERYFPFLKADTLSSLSHKLDLNTGVTSIGKLSFKVQDVENLFSGVIKAADDIGQGLRRQLVQVYELEQGQDWITDKQKVRTMRLDSVVQDADSGEYTITGHDIQSDMQGTVFEPALTTLAGAVTASSTSFTVTDSSGFNLVAQPAYGTRGLMKVDDEILMWQAKSISHVMTVSLAERGLFGTVAAAHDLGADVTEVIMLRGNPLEIAMMVLTSTGSGTNGSYDRLPEHWGLGLDATDDVDIAEWEAVAEAIAGFEVGTADSGMSYEFKYNKAMSGKMFIESRILKQIGAFAYVHNDGKYGLRQYINLATAQRENAARVLNESNIVSMSPIKMDLSGIVNDILMKYDVYPSLTSTYIRAVRFLDYASILKHGRQKQPLTLLADGLRADHPLSVSSMYQRAHIIGAQLSTPPRRIKVTLLPREADIELGEVVRLSWGVRDAFTGNDLDIAAMVDSISISPKTGEPVVTLRAQHEKASFWSGSTGDIYALTLSPANLQEGIADSYQLITRASDGGGNKLPTPVVIYKSSDEAIATVSASGLVTGIANGSVTITAYTGGIVSNEVSVTIQPSSILPVASVTISPASIDLAHGESQTVSALVEDANGDYISGSTINWLSDDATIATVGATGDTQTVTADAANSGTANITASVGAVDSLPAVATVATAFVPTFTPPFFADSVYIGTGRTEITWYGSGDQIMVGNQSLAAGDYWVNGDLQVSSGTTLTINGGVRIWALGTITVSSGGVVDGVGRGIAGAPAADSATSISNDVATQADTGIGANGGNCEIWTTYPASYPPNAGQGSPAVSPAGQLPSIVSTAESGGTTTAASGFPVMRGGGGGGSGQSAVAIQTLSYIHHTGGAGGAGGASLMLAARGIYCTGTARINLNGAVGGAPAYSVDAPANPADPLWRPYSSGGGGGGGGGSFIALAERDVNGSPVMAVDPSTVIQTGGAGGAASNLWVDSFGLGLTAPEDGKTGGTGQFLAQVIG